LAASSPGTLATQQQPLPATGHQRDTICSPPRLPSAIKFHCNAIAAPGSSAPILHRHRRPLQHWPTRIDVVDVIMIDASRYEMLPFVAEWRHVRRKWQIDASHDNCSFNGSPQNRRYRGGTFPGHRSIPRRGRGFDFDGLFVTSCHILFGGFMNSTLGRCPGRDTNRNIRRRRLMPVSFHLLPLLLRTTIAMEV